MPARALLADDADARQLLYQRAIGYLKHCRTVTQLARTNPIYGGWLRRQRRRSDARDQLRATGGHARKRGTGTAAALTPWESQIGRLASESLANRDIAAQLFISPSTVDYYLRKVFRKLNVTSRTRLARSLRSAPASSPESRS